MDERPPGAARRAHGADLGTFVVVASLAAAALHLARAFGRGGGSGALAVVFVAIALVQLMIAALAWRRVDARTCSAIALAEAVVVGWWSAGWIVGWPLGPHDGSREPWHLADVAAAALVALVLAAAVLAAVAPAAVERARHGDTRIASGAIVALVGLATLGALLSDGALDDGGATRAAAPASSAAVPTTLPVRAVAIDDQPGGTLALPGATRGVDGATGATTAAPPTTTGDRGFAALGGGRRVFAEVPVDAATRATLAEQLAGTAALVVRYPTIAAAEAAGYRRAGPFSPGVGTPYASTAPGNLDGRMDAADVTAATLLYDGTAPGSRLAGFQFLSTRPQTDGEPDGFAGPNDHWTYVRDVCEVEAAGGARTTPFGADRSVSREQCTASGGSLLPAAWFVLRVWAVPGYGVADGVFRDLNPAITCPDGSYFVKTVEAIGTTGTLCR